MDDNVRISALFGALAFIFVANLGANAQQGTTNNTAAPKAALPPMKDARDKMRTLKNKEGKEYQTAWWQELTYCGGELYALSIHADRPKENMDAFRANGNMMGNYGVHRLVTDRGLDINAARALATENFTNAARMKETSYNLSNLLTPDLRKIDRDKTTDKTLTMCSQTLSDYAAAFPELFRPQAPMSSSEQKQ